VFIVTVQAAVPEQSPLQPVKEELGSGVAVKVTTVPPVNGAEQVVPQLILAGLLVTVPLPNPARVTVKIWPPLLMATIRVKFWVALGDSVFAAVIVNG
jgi:hypothetical protein